MNDADVQFDNHGTIWLITPLTPEARQWVEENVVIEPWQRFGGGFAAEPRLVQNLMAGMTQAGLIIR